MFRGLRITPEKKQKTPLSWEYCSDFLLSSPRTPQVPLHSSNPTEKLEVPRNSSG